MASFEKATSGHALNLDDSVGTQAGSVSTSLNSGSTVKSVVVVRGEMECSLCSIVGILSKVSTGDNVSLGK